MTGSPTGIDRVELAYAEHFLARPDAEGVVHLPFMNGLRLTRREKTDTLVQNLSERWLGQRAEDRTEWTDIQDRLDHGRSVRPRTAASGKTSTFLRNEATKYTGKLAHMTGTAPAARSDGKTVYLHVSHSHLNDPEVFRPLKAAGIKLVFFVHDLIPLNFPEYARPSIPERHARRMTTVSELADLIVVNSGSTKDELLAFQKEKRLPSPPVVVAFLGIDHLPRESGPVFHTTRPYFLFVSTIEARKNHAFLLALWRELVAQHGPKAPQLILVGKRGWEAESAFDLLDRCDKLKDSVIELGSISDAALAGLYRGATGTVFPSFAEGFSFPVLESIVWGLPTLASDVPVHRELAGQQAVLLGPLNGAAWKEQIMRLSRTPAPTAQKPGGDLGMSWQDHFNTLSAALDDL